MDLGLKGKIALITGSTRGLGRATAETLAREGAKVVITGKSKESVSSTLTEMRDKYPLQIWGYPADATDSEAIKDFFKTSIISKEGKLDILINNIGNLEKFGSFRNLEDEDWLRCYNITFMSMVRFTREAIPYLENSVAGRIINISSLPSHQPGSFNPHYSTTKAAMNNLTKHLANLLGNKNILVNAICPSSLGGGGWMENIIDRAKKNDISAVKAEQIMREEESNKSPLGRMGTLEDAVNLAIYLASDKAQFLTGHIYNVDGGITRGI